MRGILLFLSVCVAAVSATYTIHIRAPTYISHALQTTPFDDNEVIAVLYGTFHERIVIPHHIHYIRFTTELFEEGKAISVPTVEEVEAVIVGDGHHAYNDSLASVTFCGIGFTTGGQPTGEPLFYARLSYEIHFEMCAFTGMPQRTIGSMEDSYFCYDCMVDPDYEGDVGDVRHYRSIAEAIDAEDCHTILIGKFDVIGHLNDDREVSVYMTDSKLYDLTYSEDMDVIRVTVARDNLQTLHLSHEEGDPIPEDSLPEPVEQSGESL